MPFDKSDVSAEDSELIRTKLISLYEDIELKITKKNKDDHGLVVMLYKSQEVTLNTFRNKYLVHHDKEFYDLSRWADIYFVYTNPETEKLLDDIINYLNKYNKLFFNSIYAFNGLHVMNKQNNIHLNFLKEKFEFDLNIHHKDCKDLTP